MMTNKLSMVGGVALGAAFLFLGGGKLLGPDEVVRNFEAWGLPVWLVYVTGVMEIVGGLLSAGPRTRFFGAALIAVIMLGAIGTHVTNADFGGMFPLALLFLAWALGLAYLSRPQAGVLVAPTPR